MFSADELYGSICAVALRDNFTQLDSIRKILDAKPELATQECYVVLNEFESDLLPSSAVHDKYTKTSKSFFMSFARHFKCYIYNPELETIEAIDRSMLVDPIMDNAKF